MASTYPLSHSLGQEPVVPAKRVSAAPVKRSFFRAIYDAMIQAQARRAEREIERYLGTARFTDSAEPHRLSVLSPYLPVRRPRDPVR